MTHSQFPKHIRTHIRLNKGIVRQDRNEWIIKSNWMLKARLNSYVNFTRSPHPFAMCELFRGRRRLFIRHNGKCFLPVLSCSTFLWFLINISTLTAAEIIRRSTRIVDLHFTVESFMRIILWFVQWLKSVWGRADLRAKMLRGGKISEWIRNSNFKITLPRKLFNEIVKASARGSEKVH